MTLADDMIKEVEISGEKMRIQQKEFQEYIASQLSYYSSYFEAVLFGEGDMNDNSNCPEMLDNIFSIYDIDQISLLEQFQELDLFFKEADDTLEKTDYDHDHACHDFYFTRVRHGVGFWENDYCEENEGQILTDLAQDFGSIHCYVENGKVFITNG